jgi:hypothetical protein
MNGPVTKDSPLTRRLVHAVDHPLRVRMLRHLLVGRGSASSFAAVLGAPLSTCSYHLSRVLFVSCDLLEVVEEHQRRGACEKVFVVGEEHRAVVSRALGFIGELDSDARGEGSEQPWGLVSVDSNGERELASAINAFRSTVNSVANRCATEGGANRELLVGAVAFGVPGPRTA